jgi:CheY-like chemotaxis protein
MFWLKTTWRSVTDSRFGSAPLSKSVLIVDDDVDVIAVLAEVLTLSGMETTKASNGAEGLEIAAHLTPDLILVDYHMPVMDGPCMVRALRERSIDIPIILYSAASDAPLIALDLGVKFLPKPFTISQLLGAVDGLLPSAA